MFKDFHLEVSDWVKKTLSDFTVTPTTSIIAFYYHRSDFGYEFWVESYRGDYDPHEDWMLSVPESSSEVLELNTDAHSMTDDDIRKNLERSVKTANTQIPVNLPRSLEVILSNNIGTVSREIWRRN